ncbi:MAG: efflux RND transporter periplasmic adaptor subunit [Sulfurimonas sp.]|jgi:Cu(I)/Ag(I) efflux system membrane fusion protein|nr:efflux RND transporter periplasmic adaptor subunit [Sulfurimonas sp.]MBU1217706.1 efflux RND transporter periplasmic adaptor subunit [bacterium]MBU1434266.1 efflux RND transporter periplasmic adaptor subunit [bacterium]MBU1503657.1 efflux RND transporter periplasmic adaptor subunit [bacterium]MBU3939475.1 efflux RND transporter periplasmic adaptor subunit [bacterium]
MKHLLLLAFSVLLLAGENKISVSQLFGVKTVKVQKQTSAKVQKNFGFVKADESSRYVVSARFGGYVEVLYADSLYKEVKEGDILAKVYSPEVLRAKEEYLAALKFDTIRKNTQMVASAREKLTLLNISNAEIKEIEKTQTASAFTNIRAPKSGTVFAKSISNLDAFNAKQKLFEIVNLDSVWVEARVHQKELAELSQMDAFKVNAIGIEQTFHAKKELLYPSLDTKEATLTLRLSVANKKHLLKEGMYVTLNASAKEQAFLTLPVSAVIRKNGAFFVFAVGEYEGEYEPLEVEASILNADTYIVSGLEEGTEVVNNALFLMDSDAQINGLY